LKRVWTRISNWEQWPFFLIYTPLGLVWLYYAFKAKAFWFFSNVNPTLEFSGFEGETKREMYEQLPKRLYPDTIYVKAGIDFSLVVNDLLRTPLKYPLIVKPEIGMQGILFRKLENETQLADYHQHIPVDYLIQEFIDLPLEFSVFHIRYPGQEKGKVTGFILKEYMFVQGDGFSTLYQLIKQHPKARYRMEEMRHKHGEHFKNVIRVGEKYVLSIAGNHNRGARFVNLHKQVDQRLCDVFDKISNETTHFYYGRYDIKCTSIEDLKAGKNIAILEFNGTGAEPNHIYDCGMNYFEALKEVARHWRDLYEIGKINRKQGVRYWSFLQGYLHLKKAGRFFSTLRKYDNEY
jgi:hypothetical protein